MDEPLSQLLPHLPEDRVAPETLNKLWRWLNDPSNQSSFTSGIPDIDQATSRRWLGRRLIWWPRGVVEGRRIALISSRLGRQLDTKPTWFTVLRAACSKAQHDDVFVVAMNTAVEPFVSRCAELFGLNLLRINIPDGKSTLDSWLNNLSETASGMHANISDAYVSPPLDEECACIAAPLRDRAVVAISNHIITLHLRHDGNLHRLLSERLSDKEFPNASVFIGLGPGLAERIVADELMNQGAVGWHVLQTDHDQSTDAKVSSTSHLAPVIPLPTSSNWQYLTHCTRRRTGPWPDQQEDEFLDDLIFQRPSADHSQLSALTRIIRQQKLSAASESVRGSTPVVSFTAVPLAELPTLRKYRSHRGRWDFEPYGICIHAERLRQLGAQQAIYGDEEMWNQLTIDEQPLFQVGSTHTRTGNKIDWSLEQEWRVVGDVDLTGVEENDAFVFVPTEGEAIRIAQFSPWPVTVLSS